MVYLFSSRETSKRRRALEERRKQAQQREEIERQEGSVNMFEFFENIFY